MSRSKRTSATPNIAIELEKIDAEIARWNGGDFSAGALMAATWEDFISTPGLSLNELIAAEKLRRQKAREAKNGEG
jgi:hypothetical protein